MKEIRSQLLDCYHAGLACVRGDKAVQAYLNRQALPSSVHVVAIGKAATAMTLGVLATVPDRVKDGLLITKHKHLVSELTDDARFECIESDHPVPDQQTIRAGKSLLAYLHKHAQPGEHFLFLLSGGASSLVEVLPEDMSLEDLRELNKELLATGLDIEQMNLVRRALSQIKAGRLVKFLNGCATLNLLISDVPGDDPAVIGSGLLTAAPSRLLRSDYSQKILALLDRYRVPVSLQAEDFTAVKTEIVACLDKAKQAVADRARALGFSVQLVPQFLCGDAQQVAAAIVAAARKNPGVLLVYGGETQVHLPAHPGRGGRNQHLALSAAIELQADDGIYLLAGGTDGTDGMSTAAGGLVDSGTVSRGESMGLDARAFLRQADSGHFLEASNDLLVTGPTGTNVMDLVLAYNSNAKSVH